MNEVLTELTATAVRAAVARMNRQEREFLQQLVLHGTRPEAVRFVQIFHHFPGVRMIPSVVDEDPLETQIRLEVWEDQDAKLN